MKLGDSAIHVWLAFDREIGDPALLAVCDAMLEPGERERLGRMYFERDRHQFLITRALQRSVLSAYLDRAAPAQLRFAQGPRGRPELAAPFAGHGLFFNIAHTPGLVAMAVSREPMLGVDVENVVTRPAPLQLANRYFTESEALGLQQLAASEQTARFFALWTLKESWLKATGQGIAAGLANVSFELDAAHAVRRVTLAADQGARWRFWQFQPSDEHALALALRTEPPARDWQVIVHRWRGSSQEQGAQT